MSLPVENVAFSNEVFDSSVTEPAVVHRLVSESNLYGHEGSVWERFRYSKLLNEDQTRKALLNKTRLQPEELACLLFDVQMQVLRRLKFKYSYTNNMSVFSTDMAKVGTDLSCLGCTRSFAGLLYSFGFEPKVLKCQKSNPTDNDAVKVVMKPAFPDIIQGFHGSAVVVPYDYDTMSPTIDELSNGFKPVSLFTGGFAVKMTPRDPFLNHFCVYVDAGFRNPYFDPLTGARYPNGQGDLFAAYQRWSVGDVMCGAENVMVYCQNDQIQSRLYSIPKSINFDGNPDFTLARNKYSSEMLQLWLLIDPADWTAQSEAITRPRADAMSATGPPALQRPRANAMTGTMLAQHPPIIRNLFRLG